MCKVNSINAKQRLGLKIACSWLGGIRQVAISAGVDRGNLSKWLKGNPTLSEENVGRVLRAVGLPNGNPMSGIVHVWKRRVIDAKEDMSAAFDLFFPNGFEIASAPWSKPGLKNMHRAALPMVYTNNVFAITDGEVRAIFRLPSTLALYEDHFGKNGSWKLSSRKEATLDINEDDDDWATGVPSMEKFDAAWYDEKAPSTLRDLNEERLRLGLSVEDAISAMRRIKETN